MKFLTFAALLIMPALNAFCQSDNVITPGNEVTLTLSKAGSGKFTYVITEVKKLNDTAHLSGDDLLKEKVAVNQVKLFFGPVNFGGKEATALVIKNGSATPLQYTLKIKVQNRDTFEKTSVNPLFPNVKSKELWPYKITAIVISDFQKME